MTGTVARYLEQVLDETVDETAVETTCEAETHRECNPVECVEAAYVAAEDERGCYVCGYLDCEC